MGHRDRELALVLAEFAHTLGTSFSVQEILDHLVTRIVDVLPVTGAGVMVRDRGEGLHFVAASNALVRRIEVLQRELGEGPCLTAFESGDAVAVVDLSLDTRFSRFSPRACAEGLAAVFTFPMRRDSTRLGALDLYRDTPGELDAQDLAAGQVLADVAAAYLINARDRVDSTAALDRLQHSSLHDPLTGLPNRLLLEELLDAAVARARRSHLLVAVLFVDLDGFKAVNDSYGHHVGDLLLRLVAGRLSQALRPGDTLARLAGDEFVIVCEDLALAGQAETVAERVASVLAAPFDAGGRQLGVRASVGVAFSGPGGDVAAVVLRAADEAMYEAKSRGGGRHHVLDREGRAGLAERGEREDLDRDLREALAGGQFQLAYQPVVDLRDGQLAGVEALLRWHHPRRGWVPPELAIPSLERSGLILPLGEWALRQACADLAGWRAAGLGLRNVAVNVSAHQVTAADFAAVVGRVLAETGVEPAAVYLDVTETALLVDAPRALTVMTQLKTLGVGLALDDFGTGYSSLSYLRRFPFDQVKIDRSFTSGLPDDLVARSIVRAVVDLSHVLGLTVTAEGIENPGDLDEVTALGADQGQGYHLGVPQPAGELTRHLRRVGTPRRGSSLAAGAGRD